MSDASNGSGQNGGSVKVPWVIISAAGVVISGLINYAIGQVTESLRGIHAEYAAMISQNTTMSEKLSDEEWQVERHLCIEIARHVMLEQERGT